MALAETTLSAAVALNDVSITVASATSLAAGRLVRVDGETMRVTNGYVTASLTVPVDRGQDGSAQLAHATAARVVHGTAADFGNPGAGAVTFSAPIGRPRRIVGYAAAGSMALPKAGEDLLVRLDSTAFTLTVPVPTLELDGCEVTFVGSAANVAYVLEFTGALGGGGSGYETVTWNGTGNLCFKVIAMNELWHAVVATPMTGTTAAIAAALA